MNADVAHSDNDVYIRECAKYHDCRCLQCHALLDVGLRVGDVREIVREAEDGSG